MKYLLLPLVFMLTAGCAQPPVSPPPAVYPEETPEAPADASGEIVIHGANFYLYRNDESVAGAQTQTLSIQADTFSLVGGETKQYAFEGAHAVIYGRGENNEPVVMEAARGIFVEDERAVLQDGVTATMGDLTLELQDLEWKNPQADEPGIAISNNPVRIINSTLSLEAATLRIYPDEKRVVLSEGSGSWRFEKETP
ncbi:MAG: hypothetical protein HYV27_20300 [Candidatus Hydrogenedentes bacterium]|nr:hypothetical protein [Candidatus Hydrogenedentota bacterium]